MRKILPVLFILLIFGLVLSAQDKAEKNKVVAKYIGVSVCKPCHNAEKQGKQIDIWSKSKHANAYKTLLTEEADKIAKEKGYSTKAAETEDCLKCHTLGTKINKELFAEKFKLEDGVQCETCHGAASEYKLVHTKDVEKAIEKGLVMIKDKETFCKTCHNPESPTYKEFKVDEAWSLIQHYVPKTK